MGRELIDVLLQLLWQDKPFVIDDGSVLRHAVTEEALRADCRTADTALNSESLL